MSTQQELWEFLKNSCEEALRAIGDKVTVAHPHLQFRTGKWSTDIFPLSFWGSFTNPLRQDSQGVDISIDFKWGKQVVEVSADVAYESGKILSEIPVQFIPLMEDGSLAADIASKVLTKVLDYVGEQSELIVKAIMA
jgi:hypothetical protein